MVIYYTTDSSGRGVESYDMKWKFHDVLEGNMRIVHYLTLVKPEYVRRVQAAHGVTPLANVFNELPREWLYSDAVLSAYGLCVRDGNTAICEMGPGVPFRAVMVDYVYWPLSMMSCKPLFYGGPASDLVTRRMKSEAVIVFGESDELTEDGDDVGALRLKALVSTVPVDMAVVVLKSGSTPWMAVSDVSELRSDSITCLTGIPADVYRSDKDWYEYSFTSKDMALFVLPAEVRLQHAGGYLQSARDVCLVTRGNVKFRLTGVKALPVHSYTAAGADSWLMHVCGARIYDAFSLLGMRACADVTVLRTSGAVQTSDVKHGDEYVRVSGIREGWLTGLTGVYRDAVQVREGCGSGCVRTKSSGFLAQAERDAGYGDLFVSARTVVSIRAPSGTVFSVLTRGDIVVLDNYDTATFRVSAMPGGGVPHGFGTCGPGAGALAIPYNADGFSVGGGVNWFNMRSRLDSRADDMQPPGVFSPTTVVVDPNIGYDDGNVRGRAARTLDDRVGVVDKFDRRVGSRLRVV